MLVTSMPDNNVIPSRTSRHGTSFPLGATVAWHGVKLHEPDWGHDSHTLAAATRLLGNQAQLHMIFNAYWEALAFEIPPAGDGHDGWRRIIDTSLSSPDDVRAWADAPTMEAPTYVVQPRSVVLLIAALRDDQRRPEVSRPSTTLGTTLSSSGSKGDGLARAPERTTMTSATLTDTQLDQLAINTIRTLSMDAVQAAHSGHPGTPMALAPLVYTCGIASCASTHTIRSGLGAIASCSRTGTPRCCSGRCSI